MAELSDPRYIKDTENVGDLDRFIGDTQGGNTRSRTRTAILQGTPATSPFSVDPTSGSITISAPSGTANLVSIKNAQISTYSLSGTAGNLAPAAISNLGVLGTPAMKVAPLSAGATSHYAGIDTQHLIFDFQAGIFTLPTSRFGRLRTTIFNGGNYAMTGAPQGHLSSSPSFSTDVPAQIGSGKSLKFSSFPSASQRVQFSALSPGTGGGGYPWTFSGWLKPDANIPGLTGVAWSSGVASSLPIPIIALFLNTECLALFYDSSSGNYVFTCAASKGTLAASVIAGQWNHVAAVITGASTATIYVNGASQGSVTAHEGPNTVACIGWAPHEHSQNENPLAPYSGLFDDFRCYNAALSSAEITTLAAGGSPSETISSWWKFDEGSGTTLTDSSGNGHTAYLSAPPAVSSDLPSQLSASMRSLQFDGSLSNGLQMLEVDQTNDVLGNAHISSVGSQVARWSFSGWVKPTSVPSRGLIAANAIGNRGLFIVNNSGSYYLSLYYGSSVQSVTGTDNLSTATLSLNAWHHIACTYNFGTAILYIDGVAAGTFTAVPYFDLRVSGRAAWFGSMGGASVGGNNFAGAEGLTGLMTGLSVVQNTVWSAANVASLATGGSLSLLTGNYYFTFSDLTTGIPANNQVVNSGFAVIDNAIAFDIPAAPTSTSVLLTNRLGLHTSAQTQFEAELLIGPSALGSLPATGLGRLNVGGGCFNGTPGGAGQPPSDITVGYGSSFSGNTSGAGCGLAINEATGYAGTFADFEINGINRFLVNNDGSTTMCAGDNAQSIAVKTLTELTAIAASATTDTTLQIPAGVIVLGVSVYVQTAIPTAATFTVTGATSGTTFDTAAVATGAGNSDPGTAAGAYYNASAQKVRITPNLTPGTATGKVRVTVYYFQVTPATT